ncbi:MAG: hypothetical protein ACXU82_01200 [Caulobacteraceae bacterium]
MKLKEWFSLGRPWRRAGHPSQVEDRVATLGWLCMAVVVVAAILAASYAAF